jgi:ribonuclease HI
MLNKIVKFQNGDTDLSSHAFINLASKHKPTLTKRTKSISGSVSIFKQTSSNTQVQPTSSSASTVTTTMQQPNFINVFTDGSCIQSTKKNAGSRPAGYACVFPEYPKLNFAAKLEGKEKTNNRAEFTACIVALQIAEKDIDPKFEHPIKVYTDSELLINSLTKWLPGWKAKNWKKADGSPVKNVDLLKALDDLMKKRRVVFKHVRAHTGKKDWESINNDIADRMAKTAAFAK